ncbi:MAG: imidazole glycerol phosphate synthase subunit HisH [Puniceicoccaceae bacterium]|nr:MAG: imidazole glycerol phosphate synthase subunit HisH [Puniceicoccaceae bacterium]
MGNLRSVAKALEVAGAEVVLATGPGGLEGCAGLVLPGVGALGDCIQGLETAALAAPIRDWVAADRPFLGICLGLQALFEQSEEGGVRGLGLFPGRVMRFRLPAGWKIPHMGWNEAVPVKPSPLWEGLPQSGEPFYFVHSYHVVPDDPELVWTETDYNGRLVSGIARGRCHATQFHPEKSQRAGLRIYGNFVDLCRG